ncbi:hypothetical protein DQ353_18550 [Arthrobacter sp. AQ5-05]|nr:hypothetical protein DQ353_18550 [Arthrobacter sp. AQ5-05]
MGFLASTVGLGRRLPWPSTTAAEVAANPMRLRLALEELGPTFIKLGQLLMSAVASPAPLGSVDRAPVVGAVAGR